MKKIFLFVMLCILVTSLVSAQVISLSRVSIQQNGYEGLSGDEIYIAEWRNIPISSDDLIIRFNSDQLSSQLNEQITVEDPVEMVLSQQKYGQRYDFSNPEPIYDVIFIDGYTVASYPHFSGIDVQTQCKNDINEYRAGLTQYSVAVYSVKSTWTESLCQIWVYAGNNIQGYVADVVRDQREFTSKWDIKQNGRVLDTLDVHVKAGDIQLSDRFSNNVYIKYAGSVDWLFAEPSPSNVKAFYDKSTNSWRLVSDSSWNLLLNSYNTAPDPYDTRTFSSNYIQKINSGISNMRSSTLPSDWTSSNVVNRQISGSSQTSGDLLVELTGQVSSPTFTIAVNGDFLGIRRNAGEPSIISASSINFIEGDSSESTAATTVVVKNTGTARGTFTLGAVCDATFTGSQQSFGLDANQQSSYNLVIKGKNPSDLSEVRGSCTITLTETTTGEKDTTKINVLMKSLDSCSIGAQEQFYDDIRQVYGIKVCEDGQKYVVQEYCSLGQIVVREGGVLVCQTPEGGPSQGEGDFNIVLFIITILLALAGGVYTGVITPSRKTWVRFVVGGIVFIAIFIFVPWLVGFIVDTFVGLFSL